MSNNVHIFNSTFDEYRYNKEQVHGNSFYSLFGYK